MILSIGRSPRSYALTSGSVVYLACDHQCRINKCNRLGRCALYSPNKMLFFLSYNFWSGGGTLGGASPALLSFRTLQGGSMADPFKV